jgi:predicted permease
MRFLADFRHGLRTIRRTRAFTAAAVLTLGIGLGLNTALFTLFNAYVLRPLAVRNPYSLYQLGWTTRSFQRGTFSWEQYQEVRSQAAVLTDTFASEPLRARVEQRNLTGSLVSGNLFNVLGVETILGRPIGEADASAPGADAVVVLSYQTWKTIFAGDPTVLGREISINGRPFEIIGVCREGFTGLETVPTDLYVPITMHAAVLPGPDLFGPEKPSLVNIIGRLATGISMEQAKASLTAFVTHATDQLPEAQQAIQAVLISRATALPADAKMFVVFLPLTVAFVLVLVICCANVSNMMLARALARQREIGVRLSLGASRMRLIRQLLSENLLVAALAGITGFAVSSAAIRGFQRVLFTTLPPSYAKLLHLVPLTADYRVFFFILAAAAASTILFGLAPALQGTRVSLVRALHGEFGSRVRASHLRGALLVSQIAVCVVLLALTGILLDGSSRYQQRDIGYSIRGIVSPFTPGRLDRNTMVKLAHHLGLESWVENIAGAWRRPLNGSIAPMSCLPGGTLQEIQANYNFVSPEYFGLLGIPFLRGRNFTTDESRSEAAVAIISQATQRRFWPNEDALGKIVHLVRRAPHSPEEPRFDQAVVIGITKDVVSGIIYDGIDATMLYFPASLDGNRALALFG